MASALSKELKKSYGVNAIEVRKDDEVKIMRGKFKKKQGKVTEINMKKMKVGIGGIQKTKTDGTKVNVLIHPSKIQIVGFNEEDKRRFKNLKKKTDLGVEKKEVKTSENKDKENENARKKK